MAEHAAGHVVVIGAGIVGACVALALLDEGWRVTILEPGEPGGEQAASYGNGGFISPASILPMSAPGLWKQVPGYLRDPLGPLTIRWRHLPGLLPWLIRFLGAGATEDRVRRIAGQLSRMHRDGPERHLALAQKAGCPDLIRQEGLIYAYETRADFAAEALAWRIRAENGLQWRELEEDALWQMEPALAPGHRFAAVVDAGAHCADPGAYVAALAKLASVEGARILNARATGFDLAGSALKAVATDTGPVACDAAVIAAGIGSKALAAMAGDRIPLISERGYHVQCPTAPGGPQRPVMPGKGKMSNLPGRSGLRASGQVELASTGAAPDWRRADILLDHLSDTFPRLEIDRAKVRRWYGHRPSTPDSLPVIGPSRLSARIVHAFGHGHSGLLGAPMTGAIVAAMLSGRPLPTDPAAFAASRFR